MSDHPTPAEAARALREVDQRGDQAFDSAHESRWVAVLFGAAIFLLLAAPDFFGDGVTTAISGCFGVLVLGYVALLNSRRGSTVLGRPARVRRQQISPRFARYARVAILAVAVVGVAGALLPHPDLSVPYARTIAGAVLGGAVAVFAPRWQKRLTSLARPDRAGADQGGADVAHGSR
jgi:hypothetical protein